MENENFSMTIIHSKTFWLSKLGKFERFYERFKAVQNLLSFFTITKIASATVESSNFPKWFMSFAEFAHSICSMQKPVLNGKFPYCTLLAFKISILLRVLHSQFRFDNSFGQTNSILQGMISFYLRVPQQISTTYTFKAFTTVRH